MKRIFKLIKSIFWASYAMNHHRITGTWPEEKK